MLKFSRFSNVAQDTEKKIFYKFFLTKNYQYFLPKEENLLVVFFFFKNVTEQHLLKSNPTPLTGPSST